MSYYSWAQGFSDSIKVTVPYMLWFFFFYLMQAKISINTIEKIIVIYGVLYVILYLYQFLNPQTVIFGVSEEYNDISRGLNRIVFTGGGLFYLTVFIALSRLNSNNRKRFLFWLAIVILGILITVMQITRQILAAIAIIYLIYLLKDSKFWIKIGGIVLISILISIFFNIKNPIYEQLSEVQKKDINKGENYIRILAAKYFLTDFSPNTPSKIFGNGLPYGNKSEYGKFKTNYLWSKKHYFFEDVGIIGTYALFGVFAVAGFILIFIRSIRLPLPPRFFYLKYYLWFILITSVTSDYIYRANYLITTIIVVFIYNKVLLEYKEKKLIT